MAYQATLYAIQTYHFEVSHRARVGIDRLYAVCDPWAEMRITEVYLVGKMTSAKIVRT